MKIAIIAVCLFGLVVARPGGGGDKQSDGEGKDGPKGPMGGLVKLCLALAEQAEAEGKREFDFEGALGEICEFILSEKPEKPEPTTDAPVARSLWEEVRGRGGKGGQKGGEKGGEKDGEKDGERDGERDGEGEEKDIVDVLLRICAGLAKMAEEAEQEARAIETKEDLFDAMKNVCDAAKAEAEARTTPSSA